ncbi:polyphosphate kinase 2 family protein [Phaeovibrio sulfidiphilus]|uniref:Polyphosphate kinase 2 family protein n=1 Tax=Phaeovibrio sulfidiphilus TaxID=1220600 RepID=A0A8J7CF05_9PROT|nr:polyphosphate kinase 2 family protein [Phaeovibrio sulfidiphilus]MBE1237819.1 polyphosphate kinase 2 family protein [Phaeovibrio sulfidiphilus]
MKTEKGAGHTDGPNTAEDPHGTRAHDTDGPHRLARFRITAGDGFRLADHDPDDTDGAPDNGSGSRERMEDRVRTLAKLQEKLFAHGRWGVLVLFQAMDAGGKDSCIKHIFSGVNPQGCQVVSFKTPSANEVRHDFLWRCVRALPERGHIGVFNRSFYEDVLIARVHPETLEAWNLPADCTGPDIWEHRYRDIVHLEHYLARNGTLVLKFFLHISRDEQRKRLLARLEDPDKHWKFAWSDLQERTRWDDYQSAYEDMIRATATPVAPWHVVPANSKRFARSVVMDVIIGALERLDLRTPEPDAAMRKLMARAEQLLKNDEDPGPGDGVPS